MGKGDFIVHYPTRLFRDRSLSGDARLLRALIGTYVNAKTGGTYVTGKTLQDDLGWGRGRREKAQKELCKAGWLRLGWKRGAHAVYARRLYFTCDPGIHRCAVRAQRRNGATYQLPQSESGKVISYYNPDSNN